MNNQALEYRIDDLVEEREYLLRKVEELKAENKQLKDDNERHKGQRAELVIENKKLIAKEDAYQFCIRQISGKK